MPATSIDEVLVELDVIIKACRERGSADGYFAALYRRVTAEVKAGIARAGFEDGARMEQLDVAFANRYLDAWTHKEQGVRITESWEVAFDCSRDYWPVVLQHLLLGMNAHINLDLGIAAAMVGLRSVFLVLPDGVGTKIASLYGLSRTRDCPVCTENLIRI
jgi:hypothetical protein